MAMSEWSTSSFSAYPPLGREFAERHLSLLRQLPLPLTILMLREISAYDWRFPAERRMLEVQFAWLQSLSPAELSEILRGFAQLSISAQALAQNWVGDPERASEAMTAYLWSTSQIDGFRAAADSYADAWHKAVKENGPAVPRLCIVVLSSELDDAGTPIFLKLRPHGVFFPQVDPANGMQTIFDKVSARAAAHPLPYEHWYIDGGHPEPWNDPRVTRISWGELEPLRDSILQRIQKTISRSASGPEQLRTVLAETTPSDLGLAPGSDELMNRFKISVLTEGSGTQIFSTTFAQWTAREALRRAQPSTLLVRFAPRQRQLPMDELLAGLNSHNALDPKGSLIDADMGAFYTWINQQRLTGAAQASFVAWCEPTHQAIAIGPTLPRETTAGNKMTMQQILAL
jgi:hypothetical protein